MPMIKAHDVENGFNVAMVISRFNESITEKLYNGAVARLEELGLMTEQITSVWVPGAIEIPVVAQCLARSSQYDTIIILGAVIRGETSHYDYVCQQVSYGCQSIALQTDIPIIFGVLTTENAEQALARVGGAKGHKGREAADAAYEMVSIMKQVK